MFSFGLCLSILSYLFPDAVIPQRRHSKTPAGDNESSSDTPHFIPPLPPTGQGRQQHKSFSFPASASASASSLAFPFRQQLGLSLCLTQQQRTEPLLATLAFAALRLVDSRVPAQRLHEGFTFRDLASVRILTGSATRYAHRSPLRAISDQVASSLPVTILDTSWDLPSIYHFKEDISDLTTQLKPPGHRTTRNDCSKERGIWRPCYEKRGVCVRERIGSDFI